MGSPIPPAVTNAVALTEQDIARIVQPIIAQLNAPGAVKQFIAKAESEATAATGAFVIDLKSLPWGHVVTYIMSVATPIGIHLLGLFGL